MALVVNTNEEDYTATGITPSDFNVKFTNLNSAIDYATAYVKDLKITQAAKNVLNQKRRDKNKE